MCCLRVFFGMPAGFFHFLCRNPGQAAASPPTTLEEEILPLEKSTADLRQSAPLASIE